MGGNFSTPGDDESFESRYVVEDEPFAQGKFSYVFRACRRDENPKVKDGRLVGSAKLAMKDVANRMGDDATRRRIAEEIEVLKVLGEHRCLVSLLDICAEEHRLRLVFAICTGGELYERIQKLGFYPEHEAKLACYNLLEGCAYIHSRGIMHRDLKPENILLKTQTSNTDVKICDFGLSKMSRDYPRRLPRSHSICGSDFYLAPEVIKQEEYGREIDIWALGVITYVLLSGSLPFYHGVLHKLYRQIVERDLNFPEQIWSNVSKGALDFILRLLQVRAGDRLTADQALSHPWLRSSEMGNSFDHYEAHHPQQQQQQQHLQHQHHVAPMHRQAMQPQGGSWQQHQHQQHLRMTPTPARTVPPRVVPVSKLAPGGYPQQQQQQVPHQQHPRQHHKQQPMSRA